MAAIIYNLAFATNLYFLKLHKCSVSSPGSINDVVEALFKLLKINSSLEILDCSYINNLNGSLSKDFCLHLGEMLTLRNLDLEGSGKFTDAVLGNLGKAIAFNARKNGVLENINLKSSLNRSSNIVNLFKNMNISDHDHEVWYGDPIKA
jgi:hypothetical protein